MASLTRAPMLSYPGTILPIHDHPAWEHLSGTTMETTTAKAPPAQGKDSTVATKEPTVATKEPTVATKEPTVVAEEPIVATKEPTVANKEPMIYLPTGNKTLNRFSDITTSTRRASYASTTKSQLRQSNHQLFEMLQTIQAELATHRAIMLDVQTRLSFIEQDAPTMVEDGATEVLSPAGDLKPPQRPPPPPPRRASSLIPPGRESQSWWQSCQNFAENCDTPFSAQEFLKTSARFEDFDFHFGGLSTGEEIPPASPIEVLENPALSPESKRQSSENDGPTSPSIFSEGAPRTSGLTMEDYEERDNIIEQIVEFRKPAVLPPLLLHPPPSGRTTSLLSVEEITALPDLPPATEVVNEAQRHRKGIRSISSKWASLKGRSTDPGDYRKGFFSMR
ncbi:hypothetical protein EKO04_011419 [Ascochyta lentis]|uniref:Uncharacterized protein n=1 Tax=Ascochyta lentis TaxID=205686 RepID=A0A8H7ISZ9_9PLEO|nr:hypothetical protein EKO04_011419 [Ascochyta lentis]